MTTDIDRLISNTLRTGVIASVLTILLGMTITFVRHPWYFRSAPPAGSSSLQAVMTGVAHGRGEAIAMLGVLFLIATPVVRVMMSIAVFAMQRDRRYVAITITVLVLLVISFITGAGE